MKILSLLFILILTACATKQSENTQTVTQTVTQPSNNTTMPEVWASLYDFSLNAIDGQPIALSQYKGKKIVIMNVASKCGYTKQYEDWEAFHQSHGKDVVVLGFPANNFMGQEPGSNTEIAAFCKKNYGVSFQLFEKIEVIGKDQHPLYQFLSDKTKNGNIDKSPSWNFCKYIIDEKGSVTHFFGSNVKPDNAEFLSAIGL